MPNRMVQSRMNRMRATGVGPSTQAQNKMLGGAPINGMNGGSNTPLNTGMPPMNSRPPIPMGLGPSPNMQQSLINRAPVDPIPNGGMPSRPQMMTTGGQLPQQPQMMTNNGQLPGGLGPSPNAMASIMNGPQMATSSGQLPMPDEQKRRAMITGL